jgi:hypothetical protein
LDMDEFQDFFKKYSPLIISLVGVLFLLVVGEIKRAWLLLAVGLAMQYFWMRFKYPRNYSAKDSKKYSRKSRVTSSLSKSKSVANRIYHC